VTKRGRPGRRSFTPSWGSMSRSQRDPAGGGGTRTPLPLAPGQIRLLKVLLQRRSTAAGPPSAAAPASPEASRGLDLVVHLDPRRTFPASSHRAQRTESQSRFRPRRRGTDAVRLRQRRSTASEFWAAADEAARRTAPTPNRFEG
jgi:hypothetical protein